MKQIIACTFALGLAVTPAFAQDETSPETDDGFSLMEEGARLMMRGLMSEMEPAMEDFAESLTDMGPALQDLAATIGPAFADVLEQVDDFRNYEPPEVLPNGDIILRRKPDAPAWEPDPETGEIEL